MSIGIIGLGLIGGSALRALAAAGHQVYGYDADPGTRATARTASALARAGTRWHLTSSVADAARTADLVIVAVPLPAVTGVFAELAASGYAGVVTDVTSVKGRVRELAAERLRGAGEAGATYIGGHPMAGRETSGFDASDPALFDGCAWVLCLEPEETALRDWLKLAILVTSLGARVVPATAADHDRAVAAVSHVPHLVAAAVAAGAASDHLAATLAAGSYRDGTRVAASQPALVAAMCGGNTEAVAAALDGLLADLATARAALDAADPIAALTPWLTPGSAARNAWPPRPGEPTELPAEPEALLRLGRAGGWVTAIAPDRRTVTAVRPAP